MLIPNDKDQRRLVSVQQAEIEYHKKARVSVRQAVKSGDARRAEILRKPFGFQNANWEALKAQMQPGDELWEFCSSRASWDELMGRAGYELVRDGVVIAAQMSRMN